MQQQQTPSPAEMYEQYFVPGLHARWTPLFLDHAEPEPGQHVLDVACGTGIVARTIASLVGQEGRVVGLDISPDMLEVARSLPEPAGATIEWRQGEAESLPDGPFDRVLCQQGLQFFPDPTAALQEMRRVLAPDGQVVVSVWQALERHPLYQALIEAEARYLDTSIEVVAGPVFSLSNADELRGLVDTTGFEEVEIVEETHTVRFPEPERFVTLTLLAAAAIIPDIEMDEEARAALVQAVGGGIAPVLQEYVEGDTVSFPMHAHIMVAST